MKTLKLLTTFGVALVLTSCSLFQGPDGRVSPARLKAISKLAAYTGTSATLVLYPDSRADIQKSYEVLNDLVKQDTWDAIAVAKVLNDHGITSLVGNEGYVVVTSGILIVDTFFGINYDVKSNVNVEAVITGLRDGLGLALSAPRKGPWENDLILERLKAEAEATR